MFLTPCRSSGKEKQEEWLIKYIYMQIARLLVFSAASVQLYICMYNENCEHTSH